MAMIAEFFPHGRQGPIHPITKINNNSTVINPLWVNTLRPRQNGRYFAEDTFKCIFVNVDIRVVMKISLKFVPKGPINNIPALVQIMAWRQSGDKPISEPMLVFVPTHICVTRPQWVNSIFWWIYWHMAHTPHYWDLTLTPLCSTAYIIWWVVLCRVQSGFITVVTDDFPDLTDIKEWLRE